jgi:pimeloyl-ACP methyl ester carboxylesterase
MVRSRWGPALAGVLGLLTVVATTACSTRAASDGIAWGDCTSVVDVSAAALPAERLGRLQFSCASVPVPLDPERSASGDATAPGRTIAVQLIRVHRRAEGAPTSEPEPPRPPLLLIAGGPGQSGVDYALVAAGYYIPTRLLDRFDLVGFDPRGVARTSPIRCQHKETGPMPLPDLVSANGYEEISASVREATGECLSRLGDSAGLYNTTATAHDIDQIRAALGQRELTYVGWSYGAKLGAEYARLFPTRVRAAVLDAPTDPTVPWVDTVDRQLAGFEASFDRFVAWCRSQPSCERLGGDIRAFASSLVERAERAPIRSGRPGDTDPSNGTDLINGIASALYDDVRFPDLADGLAEAEAGDSGTLRELAEAGRGKDENATDAQRVINCNDSRPEPSVAEVRAAAARLVERYPLFGAWGSGHLLQCMFWTAPRHTLAPPVAPTTHPLVVVGTLHDPATPYAGAEAMSKSLGDAVLVTWEGSGHTAFGRSPCVNDHVTRYLADLAVPQVGTRCPA